MAITEKYVTNAGAGTADGSSLANALSWASMVTAINAGGTAGNRYNVNGAISRGASDTISGSGTLTSPVVIRGYSSTIGDGYLGRTNGNGPLITTNMPAVAYGTFRMNISGSYVNLESLNFSTSIATAVITTATGSMVARCKLDNSSTNAAAVGYSGGSVCSLLDCDVSLSGASGGTAAATLLSSACSAHGCRIKGGPAVGVQMASNATLTNCTVYGSALSGVATTATSSNQRIINNTIVGNTGDGINILTGTTSPQQIFGNLITDNGGYGINGVSAANAIMAAYNRLDRNTSGATNLATDWLTATSYGHNTTSGLQAAEYTAVGSDDYRLVKATSPAIANGLPSYADIGALQHQDVGGTSGPVGQCCC